LDEETLAYYEIEFLPVGNGASSGDAIVMRYWDGAAWRIGVIDGGYEETGEAVCEHIRRWYGRDAIVDFVVSTHPDNDHMSGLRVVLRELPVRELWMHVPWIHAQSIRHLFRSRNWTVDGLIREFQRNYNYVSELAHLADSQGTAIYQPFAGAHIGPFTVLSPSLEMYLGLLPQFRDTPAPDEDLLRGIGHWLTGIGRRFSQFVRKDILEAWDTETLREGGTTADENESSVVLFGDLGEGGILLTADAGLRALGAAANFANSQGIEVSNLSLFQVPHHGSRNNLAPSVLNYFIGPPVPAGVTRHTQCVVSAGPEDDDHPRQVVVNALCRRGLKPLVTRRGAIRFPSRQMEDRAGWIPVEPVAFSTNVESYD
jgi:beta-lactamase superfamily II metal-dependent hydrolase